ncbi:unnamed protein product [Lupinus luteus]|uniref:Uncharacterized protein n=1 Tax=Lupinus luteus TaxID=3873 RepID=A0AAV1X7G8_LUPLU
MVNDAFHMLHKIMIWIIGNNIDRIIEEDFDFENAGMIKNHERPQGREEEERDLRQ